MSIVNGVRADGVVLVTGGARSGKSSYAERLASEAGDRVGYIATAVVTDADMADRIARHKQSRPAEWDTFETYSGFAKLARDERFAQCDTLLLDCLTTLTTNHMMDSGLDFDTCDMKDVEALEEKITAEVDDLLNAAAGKRLIVVTNEVGQGVVPAFRMGSIFRDIAGRLNMHVAARADEVICMISGLPLRLK
jgi:adenosylcobinamide kinase/adenosylcobinamide-phosphate guanylyltransferase